MHFIQQPNEYKRQNSQVNLELVLQLESVDTNYVPCHITFNSNNTTVLSH